VSNSNMKSILQHVVQWNTYSSVSVFSRQLETHTGCQNYVTYICS
jgi:hypothetical protein